MPICRKTCKTRLNKGIIIYIQTLYESASNMQTSRRMIGGLVMGESYSKATKKQVSTSKVSTDPWGVPRTEHYDASGDRLGYSKAIKDAWGNPRTEHYDTLGKKLGESKETKDSWGMPKVEHFDKNGNKTRLGTSH